MAVTKKLLLMLVTLSPLKTIINILPDRGLSIGSLMSELTPTEIKVR
ncbi:hypothetical protein VCRA2113O323_240006 [Vibrio crassostreae]|nr:hypothetical protein VCRA2113O323_240006 [Vibrio crassostreae]